MPKIDELLVGLRPYGMASERCHRSAARRPHAPRLQIDDTSNRSWPVSGEIVFALAHTPVRWVVAPARQCARGSFNAHVGPLICTWAPPPRRIPSGLRAHQGVNTHVEGFTCEQHATPGRSGTKLSLLTRPRRMSGTKLSLLARNGPIWRNLRMQGEFCTVFTTKNPSRENFVPNTRQKRD